MVQSSFATLSCFCIDKRDVLIARVIIHAYNDHVRLLSPEPMVIDKPSLLGSKEPALLCNHLTSTLDPTRCTRVLGRPSVRQAILPWQKASQECRFSSFWIATIILRRLARLRAGSTDQCLQAAEVAAILTLVLSNVAALPKPIPETSAHPVTTSGRHLYSCAPRRCIQG
jgi:hypothetical protein